MAGTRTSIPIQDLFASVVEPIGIQEIIATIAETAEPIQNSSSGGIRSASIPPISLEEATRDVLVPDDIVTVGTQVVVVPDGLKTEGTSQTFGQQIVRADPESVLGTNTLVSVPASISTVVATIVLPAEDSVSSDRGSRNPAVIEDIVENLSNVQVFFAAANGTSAITLPPAEAAVADAGFTGIVDMAIPESREEIIMSVLDSITLSKEEVLKVLTEGQKVDLSITLKSKESDPLEFNSLQVPQQNAKFRYQHWSEGESNLASQEDPSKDPLLFQKLRNVPRYVELRWESLSVIDQITENEVLKDQEIEGIKDSAFRTPRGVGNLANSVTQKPIGNSLKTLNAASNGTSRGRIVDIHEPERAFDSVSNRHEFVNSISTVINVNVGVRPSRT